MTILMTPKLFVSLQFFSSFLGSSLIHSVQYFFYFFFFFSTSFNLSFFISSHQSHGAIFLSSCFSLFRVYSSRLCMSSIKAGTRDGFAPHCISIVLDSLLTLAHEWIYERVSGTPEKFLGHLGVCFKKDLIFFFFKSSFRCIAKWEEGTESSHICLPPHRLSHLPPLCQYPPQSGTFVANNCWTYMDT